MTQPSSHERAAANLRAWTEVLDRLERDVEAAEQLAAAATMPAAAPRPAAWEPPQIDGPLPDELLARAHEIHRRQAFAKARLAEAMERSRSEQQAPRAARPVVTSAAAPAYVDVSA